MDLQVLVNYYYIKFTYVEAGNAIMGENIGKTNASVYKQEQEKKTTSTNK